MQHKNLTPFKAADPTGAEQVSQAHCDDHQLKKRKEINLILFTTHMTFTIKRALTNAANRNPMWAICHIIDLL